MSAGVACSVRATLGRIYPSSSIYIVRRLLLHLNYATTLHYYSSGKRKGLLFYLWLFSIFTSYFIVGYVLDRGISIYLNVIYFLTTYDCMIMNVFFLEKKIFNKYTTTITTSFSERLGEASHRLCQVQWRVVHVHVQVVLPAGATHGALSLSQP